MSFVGRPSSKVLHGLAFFLKGILGLYKKQINKELWFGVNFYHGADTVQSIADKIVYFHFNLYFLKVSNHIDLISAATHPLIFLLTRFLCELPSEAVLAGRKCDGAATTRDPRLLMCLVVIRPAIKCEISRVERTLFYRGRFIARRRLAKTSYVHDMIILKVFVLGNEFLESSIYM